MGNYTKTIIIDNTVSEIEGERYHWIQTALDDTQHNDLRLNGGVIYVESGLYEIDGVTSGKETVTLPSNISIIGSGGAVVRVAKNVVAFQATNEERIHIAGFKFVVDCKNDQDQYAEYTNHLIYFQGVKNSVLEKLYFECTSPKGISSNNAAICFNGATTTCAA